MGERDGFSSKGYSRSLNSSRMLKKPASFVLTALGGSTYRKQSTASPPRLLRPRWTAFLTILGNCSDAVPHLLIGLCCPCAKSVFQQPARNCRMLVTPYDTQIGSSALLGTGLNTLPGILSLVLARYEEFMPANCGHLMTHPSPVGLSYNPGVIKQHCATHHISPILD